jgi:excisionase family DNA binding protein
VPELRFRSFAVSDPPGQSTIVRLKLAHRVHHVQIYRMTRRNCCESSLVMSARKSLPMRPIRATAASSIDEIARLLPDERHSAPPLQMSANCDPEKVEPLPPSPFLSLREAAEWLCVSKSTVKRLIAKGELTAIRIGKRQRISAECLSTYVTRDILLPDAVSDARPCLTEERIWNSLKVRT